ncbi:hypothetical protein [Streptomyces spinosirectus]
MTGPGAPNEDLPGENPPGEDPPDGELLPAPWRLPFELAREAFRAGSRPVGAVVHVRHVVYVAADPKWRGIEDVPGVGGLIADRWARREGPVGGPLAVFGTLLMQLWALRHRPTELAPGAARTARRRLAAADGLPGAPTAGAAYALLRPHL